MSDDLIRRSDAIKALRKRWARTVSYDGIGEDIGEECAEAIKAVPSADRPRIDLLSDCTGCRFVGTYDTEFPCANCVRKNKDYYSAEQTERQKNKQETL